MVGVGVGVKVGAPVAVGVGVGVSVGVGVEVGHASTARFGAGSTPPASRVQPVRGTTYGVVELFLYKIKALGINCCSIQNGLFQ
jgi:hypothetical protein